MKKLVLTFFALAAFCALVYAGPEPISGKEMKQVVPAPPPCDWYRAHEWNIALWGAYAFSNRSGHFDFPPAHDFGDGTRIEDVNGVFDVGPLSKDRFLNKDHAWGGGIDVKYFWSRYFGLGVEGFVLNSRNTGGGGLGTLTLRYPIDCSRFAPYVFAGGGVVAGGSHTEQFFIQANQETEEPDIAFFDPKVEDEDAQAVGQFGGGLEIRITRHIGWLGDFSWNVVDGPHNNFGMVRTGINFAF